MSEVKPVPVAATLEDAAADPALTLDVARELLRDAAAGIRSLAASAKRAEARAVELEAEVAAKQARIDALMLEYCPDEMTPEQAAEWARHQRPVSQQAGDAAAIQGEEVS